MAVDANVLVFERVREEFKISGRISSALQAGYRKAFSAIVDSNITTIIAALILIQFDSGPIKGFAVTLIIGIISSMFTALFMTRFFFAGWVQNPKNKQLTMSPVYRPTRTSTFWLKLRKPVRFHLLIMIAGGVLFFAQFKTIFGMDFTGGYSVVIDLVEKPDDTSYRTGKQLMLCWRMEPHSTISKSASSAVLISCAYNSARPWKKKAILFIRCLKIIPEGKFAHAYQSNPRLVWVVNSLAEARLQVQPSQLDSLDRDWTVMSGQFSDAMRYNAMIGI